MTFERARIVMEGLFGEMYSKEYVTEEAIQIPPEYFGILDKQGEQVDKYFEDLHRSIGVEPEHTLFFALWKGAVLDRVNLIYNIDHVWVIKKGIKDVLEGRSDVLVKD